MPDCVLKESAREVWSCAAFVNSATITYENAIDYLLYADSKNCRLSEEAVMDFIYDNRKEDMTKWTFDKVLQ